MTTTAIDEQIQAAERTRTEALKRQDTASLERLLAPDYIYIHASGRSEDKDTYLRAIGSGAFQWTGFHHVDTIVRPVAADTALMYGFVHATKQQAGEERTLLFRSVSVWVRDGDEWKLTFQQNAKPVAAS